MKNKIALFTLILIALFFCFQNEANAQYNSIHSHPILNSVSTNPASAGYGQMVTVFGKHLLPDRLTQLTLEPKDRPWQAPFKCSFIFLGASSSDSLHVRFLAGYSKNPPKDCPNGLHPAPGLYSLTVTTSAGTSNAIPIEISAKPGTPVIRSLRIWPKERIQNNGADPVFRVGERMVVSAFGIDTSGAKARFEQGMNQIQVTYKRAISSNARGIGAEYVIPATLFPGGAQVRIQTRVGRVSSEWSEPFTFQVIR
jgi:hypothetical protein